MSSFFLINVAVYFQQYVQVSSFLTFHFLSFNVHMYANLNTHTDKQINMSTHRQTNKHEHPIVSVLEKIKVVVSFFQNWAIHSHILYSKSSTLPKITSGIVLIYVKHLQ